MTSRDHAPPAGTALDRPTVLVSALMALVEAGIPTDIQGLLLHGSKTRGVRPGALAQAIEAARASAGWGPSSAKPLDGEGSRDAT